MVSFETIFQELVHACDGIEERKKLALSGIYDAETIIREFNTIGFITPRHSGKTNWIGEQLQEYADYAVLCGSELQQRYLYDHPSLGSQILIKVSAEVLNFNYIFVDEYSANGISLYSKLVTLLAENIQTHFHIRVVKVG